MKSFKLILILTCISLVVSKSFAQTKIMSFNIRYDTPNDNENWWELRKDEVVEMLKYYSPDFIGVQEAMPKQLNFISNNLDIYDYIGHGRDGLVTDSEGIPIFYNSAKYELLEKKIFWLSETPEKVSRGWDAALNRIVVHGVFKSKITNQIVNIINTHFDHMGENARLKSAELLIDYIRKNHLTDKKIVLMGDLNCLPTESPIKLLEQEFKNSYKIKDSSVYGPVGTFNGFDTIRSVTKQIDYIFTKNVGIKNYRCIDDRRKNNLYLSDHFPILIEI
ncbi:MAG: endonuclease/exonuclease/phosphatase family metal-dependent hydrolase [Saprospiraceae bacterium]|jgi:endonuclease/exonuclease/phosphatase family metal-dependent hydrolase